MNLKVFRIDLPLKHEFTISRGSLTTQTSVIVELEHEGIRGYGEVTENDFYGHTYDSIVASLQLAVPLLDRYIEQTPRQLWPEMRAAVDGDMFALSALDSAAHDLRGKRLGVPTWSDWQLQWNDVPESSFTIGIDAVETMVAKLNEEPGWSVYKIKLGTPNDIEIMTELRRHVDAVFRVDANCGWSADQTIDYSRRLAELGVEFIEQPLPPDSPTDQKRKVYENSALPIIADEDCQIIDDVEKCVGLYHGVNVKVCKCGGLSPALEMLTHARNQGLKTMVGCMVEGSIGISGAAQLLPLLDYADLDGAVLLSDEPARGVKVDKGIVKMSDLPGCGGEFDWERLDRFRKVDDEIVLK